MSNTFSYIIDAGLEFARPLTKRTKTDLIVLHHIEGNLTVQETHALHLSKGDKGIDYNFYVAKDGTVYKGRGLEYEGGHTMNKVGLPTYGVNARSVGIVCQGNFLKEQMGDVQKAALKKLVSDIVTYYKFSSVLQIVTHREIAGDAHTNCPGTYFPTEDIIAYIMNGGNDVNEPTVEQTEDPLIWKVAVDKLNFRESPNGRILKALSRGDKVYLKRYVKKEKWARVRLGNDSGQEGYVWLQYISK